MYPVLFTPEAINSKLREAEFLLDQGKSISQACRQISVSADTYYLWRNEYDGMKVDETMRLEDLEKENARLKKMVADLLCDKPY